MLSTNQNSVHDSQHGTDNEEAAYVFSQFSLCNLLCVTPKMTQRGDHEVPPMTEDSLPLEVTEEEEGEISDADTILAVDDGAEDWEGDDSTE